METVYLINGSGGGGETVVPARYRLIDKEVEEGSVQLTDRCVTRVILDTPDRVKIILPPIQEGYVRDFFARIVITADELPEKECGPYPCWRINEFPCRLYKLTRDVLS